jgi:hypothetical protein
MFLWKSGLVLGGLAAAGGSLQALMAQPANGQRWDPGYGPLFPTLDKNTGLPLLLLPEGFTYESFGCLLDLGLKPAVAQRIVAVGRLSDSLH